MLHKNNFSNIYLLVIILCVTFVQEIHAFKINVITPYGLEALKIGMTEYELIRLKSKFQLSSSETRIFDCIGYSNEKRRLNLHVDGKKLELITVFSDGTKADNSRYTTLEGARLGGSLSVLRATFKTPDYTYHEHQDPNESDPELYRWIVVTKTSWKVNGKPVGYLFEVAKPSMTATIFSQGWIKSIRAGFVDTLKLKEGCA